MSRLNSGKRKLWIVALVIVLVIVILFGFLSTSSLFSAPTPIVPVINAANVQLGPMGLVAPMGCTTSGYLVVDPPPGQPFQDPVLMQDTNPDPDIVECNVEAKMASININGIQANLHTYNGYYPAPTIVFKRGDLLKIHFKNSLVTTGDAVNMLGFQTDVVNIHTHGLHVSPNEPSDHPDVAIEPGASYDYEYNTSLCSEDSLNFYHSHVHGRTAEMYDIGGVMLTEGNESLAIDEYETHILFIKDISIVNGERAPYLNVVEYVVGKQGEIVMVNGQVNPVLNIRPGQVQRWRIVNACNARFIMLSLQGHNLQLIGSDSDLLDKPYTMTELLLTPSERADILVKADQSQGSYKLLALPYNSGCGVIPEMVTLMTVNYSGEPSNDQLPSVVEADEVRLNMDLSNLIHRRLVLSMGNGRGYINGMDFDIAAFNITSTVNTYEVWDISSQCMMDHVFHMHINDFQVLGISGGYAGYGIFTQIPAYKDSVLVPREGTVSLLVRVLDYTGMTMFHCHIVDHEDIGMMGNWMIEPATNQTATTSGMGGM